MNFTYTPEDFDKGACAYYVELDRKMQFPSLSGLLVRSGISRKEYDLMCETEEYEAVIEKHMNMRADFLMRGMNDTKKSPGYSKLLALPENGGYSEKNSEPQKKLIIEIREFIDDSEPVEENRTAGEGSGNAEDNPADAE